MPLSLKGKIMLRKFQREYGKKKGTKVFYAWENLHKENKKWLLR
jgi:hypothetical protein